MKLMLGALEGRLNRFLMKILVTLLMWRWKNGFMPGADVHIREILISIVDQIKIFAAFAVIIYKFQVLNGERLVMPSHV